MTQEPSHWVEVHAEELRELSERVGTDEQLTHAVAAMVVHGFSDEEIFAEFSGRILVWDGQHNPLDPVRVVLPEVRRAVAES